MALKYGHKKPFGSNFGHISRLRPFSREVTDLLSIDTNFNGEKNVCRLLPSSAQGLMCDFHDTVMTFIQLSSF